MKLKLLTLGVVFSLSLFPCDICGNFMGLTPYDNQSQLTLLQRYRVYNGYRTYAERSSFFIPGAYRTMHNPTAGVGDTATDVKNHSSHDYETYKIFELRGKYFLHPRWEVNFIMPIQQIKTKYDEVKNTNTGVADPSVFAAYHLIKRLSGYTLRQRLILGAGIKFPLGNYQKENDKAQRLFLLTQNGTGSWDHFYYVNYIVSHAWWGVSSNSLFKINGRNKYHEKLANSFNQALSLFARVNIKNVRLYPAALATYEYSRGVLVYNKVMAGTNMNVLLLGPSLDIGYKNMVLNLSYQFNAYERVSSESLATSGRMVIGLTFNFGQDKYLIRS